MLWGKIELDEEEQTLISHYQFANAILIEALQPKLLREGVLVGFIVAVLFSFLAIGRVGLGIGFILGIGVWIGVGWFYVNERRETIFVRDLIHGRHFKCDSVIDLARKEAWLSTAVSFLRQVMESAKHWDGTEKNRIEPLPKDEARQVILRGL